MPSPTIATDFPDLQLAVNATPPGGMLWLPPASYPLTSTLVISQDIMLQGSGRTKTQIVPPKGVDGIQVQGNAWVKFQDFSVTGTYQDTSGSLIHIQSGCGNSIFRDLQLNFGWTGLEIDAGSTHVIDSVLSEQHNHAAIIIGGGEDNRIISCAVSSGQPNAAGIIYQGHGGGLSVIGTKILGGNISLMVNFDAQMSDGDLFIEACSFENTNYGIWLQCAPGGKFSNVIISGTEVEAAQYALLSFPCSGNAAWLANMVVTGNIFYGKVDVMGLFTPMVAAANIGL